MRSVGSIIALAALAGAVGGCAQERYYPRYGYSQATYYPETTTTYYPARTYYYSYPAYSYNYPTRFNVYSSKWDYYRNYQGIHDGPERPGL
jgi:hypothetical protein